MTNHDQTNLEPRWKPWKTVLFVEDDRINSDSIRRMLKDYSLEGAFRFKEILEATSSDTAFQIIKKNMDGIDLVIIDVVLQGSELDGQQICEELRKRKFRGKIILLSGKRYSSDDRTDGLELGADEYIARPYLEREMKARIEKQLLAAEASDDPMLRIGPFRFYPARKELSLPKGKSVEGKTDEEKPAKVEPVRLTEMETKAFLALYKARGNVITKKSFLTDVWNFSAKADTHTVESHIYRLRDQIRRVSPGVQYIITEGGGYRLEIDPPISAT